MNANETMNALDTLRDSIEKRGLTVSITWHYDDDADISYLGEYADNEPQGWRVNRKTGQVINPAGKVVKNITPNWSPGSYQWFDLEGNHPPYNAKNWEHVSREPRKIACDKYGVKNIVQLSLVYALADYERYESYGDSWHMAGCIVSIRHNGKELGHASLWGIESDSGSDYMASIELELLEEAWQDAIPHTQSVIESLNTALELLKEDHDDSHNPTPSVMDKSAKEIMYTESAGIAGKTRGLATLALSHVTITTSDNPNIKAYTFDDKTPSWVWEMIDAAVLPDSTCESVYAGILYNALKWVQIDTTPFTMGYQNMVPDILEKWACEVGIILTPDDTQSWEFANETYKDEVRRVYWIILGYLANLNS